MKFQVIVLVAELDDEEFFAFSNQESSDNYASQYAVPQARGRGRPIIIIEIKIPQSVGDVRQSPNKEEWLNAREKEMASLRKNETWNLVDCEKTINTKIGIYAEEKRARRN